MTSNDYNGPARVGQMRPSQLIHSFGVGGLIDLPHLSVMVNGLHDWNERHATPVIEERLLAFVRMQPGLRSVSALRRPPWIPETRNAYDDWARVGVPVSPFPRWLRCPWGACQYLGPIDDGQFEKSPSNPNRPDTAAYIHKNCRKKGKGATAVPVRFMLACERGHLDEFPWIDYVHRRTPCNAPLLEMSERGQSSGPADVFVKCRNCQALRTMADAFGESARSSLPLCRGHHPHLGVYEPGCQSEVRSLLLGASNAWFAAGFSVLSIPAGLDPLPRIVEELWPLLDEITDRPVFDFALRRDASLSRLQDFDNDEVWHAIEGRRAGPLDDSGDDDADDHLDLLGPEWQQFTHPDDAPDSDDFRLRAEDPPAAFSSLIDGVVRVERLREVVAFTGFTRLSAPNENADKLVPISRRTPSWLPAVETRGEGVFIRLSEAAVQAWELDYRPSERYEQLFEAHKNWRHRRNMDPSSGWPGARYVLLHTLSHALMREFALDCGYSASSISERIYSRAGTDPLAGILLYTSAPDSEGTLGGLVSLGRSERLGELMRQALQHALICTSDPTCAEHRAGDVGDDHLHGAACHACLFASETSCERGNRYLDRGALVSTLATGDVPFFDDALRTATSS